MAERVDPRTMEDEQRQPAVPAWDFGVTIGEPWTSRIGSIQARVRIAIRDLATGEPVKDTHEVLRIDDLPARRAASDALVHGLLQADGGVVRATACRLMDRMQDACVAALERLDEEAAPVRIGAEPPPRDEFAWGGSGDRGALRVPMNAAAVLYGDPETNKSTAAMHLAVAMAAAGRKVLWIDTENEPDDTRRLAWRVARGSGCVPPSGLRILRTRQLSLGQRVDVLRRAVRAREINYVICDSATMACDGELSSSEHAKAYFEALSRVCSGAGSMTICHTPKSSQSSGPLGSRVWTSYPRLVLRVETDDGDNADTGLLGQAAGRKPLRMEIEKASDGQAGHLILSVMHTDDRAVIRVLGVEREAVRAEPGMPAERLLDMLYERLQGDANGWGAAAFRAAAAAVEEAAGVPRRDRRNAETLWNMIEADGRFVVRQEGRGTTRIIRTQERAAEVDAEAAGPSAPSWSDLLAAAGRSVPETGSINLETLVSRIMEVAGITRQRARDVVARIRSGECPAIDVTEGRRGAILFSRRSG